MRIYRDRGPARRTRTRGGIGSGGYRQSFRTTYQGNMSIDQGQGIDLTMGPVSDVSLHHGTQTAPPSLIAPPRQKRRAPRTANEWVERNLPKLQRHGGKWVAISEKGIQGISGDLDGAFHQAASKGVTNPLVFKVPRANAPRRVVSMRRA